MSITGAVAPLRQLSFLGEPGVDCAASPARPAHRCRRFHLLDAMILVAATAAAFSLSRSAFGPRFHPIAKAVVTVPMLLVAWTPAVLALRLRGPRPELRRLMRQPGMAASVAATLMMATGLVLLGVVRVKLMWLAPAPYGRGVAWWVLPFYLLTGLVGPAVAGAWLHLALSGRRRPEPGWLDRLGRLVGAGWITLFFVLCGVGIALVC